MERVVSLAPNLIFFGLLREQIGNADASGRRDGFFCSRLLKSFREEQRCGCKQNEGDNDDCAGHSFGIGTLSIITKDAPGGKGTMLSRRRYRDILNRMKQSRCQKTAVVLFSAEEEIVEPLRKTITGETKKVETRFVHLRLGVKADLEELEDEWRERFDSIDAALERIAREMARKAETH